MLALGRFEQGVKEVESLLALDSTEDALTAVDASRVDHLDYFTAGATVRRSSVVLLVSHFEGLLKGIAEELTDVLSEAHVESRRIPRGIRESHILPRLEEINSCNDPEQRFALVKKLVDVASLWSDNARPPVGTLRSDIVVRRITNADSDSIDTLFRLFGSRSLICDGHIDVKLEESVDEETHNIRDRLHDIVRCRNDIAHGDSDRKPTREDVGRYVAFLECFARRIDRAAEALAEEFRAV